ncbi:threonine/serine exporter ThrE family protein [Agrococcus sp. HG114]|uniref:threonine/serine ThrE exporter family protein n=1 Tax=Agrococcus sp. HG114 TaxID=2969757 RepID=UPI00215A2D73|nr:threonine/serine exporter family protein [Agrococcus sp. HG114]MCR8669723.1 threonine/serine exporter family protein [Agrococcus sp. HG114]
MDGRQDWRRRIARAIRTDPASRPMTEALLTIDEVHARKVIDLAMRIAEALTSVGASANDVTLATTRVAAALGIRPVHVDVTYNSIGVSYHRNHDDLPITLIRVVRAPVPDHAKLQRLQALVAEIEGGLELEQARARFHAIRRTPFLYRPTFVVAAQGMLALGVTVLFGASWVVGLIAFVASCAAAVAQRGMARLRVPFFFSQIVGALVVTAAAALTGALADLGVPLLADIRPSIIIAAGIVLMLAGLSVVGAAQDAIDGFALTAGGRILELVMATLGVVIGILGGLSFASSVGMGFVVTSDPPALGPLPLQLTGAVIIAVAVAIMNGAGLRTTLVSAALGGIAWVGYTAGAGLGADPAVASGIGALVASFVGIFVAHRLHVPSIAVTTAAIVPLVPGYAVFRGLLELVESDGSPESLVLGFATLIGAGAIGIALASGASLGLFLGAPLRDSVESAMRGRGRPR